MHISFRVSVVCVNMLFMFALPFLVLLGLTITNPLNRCTTSDTYYNAINGLMGCRKISCGIGFTVPWVADRTTCPLNKGNCEGLREKRFDNAQRNFT